jgi:hypothetical protein
MAVLRTETTVYYTYNQPTNEEHYTRIAVDFTGTDAEVNWWLLSMSIAHPGGEITIYQSKAKLI